MDYRNTWKAEDSVPIANYTANPIGSLREFEKIMYLEISAPLLGNVEQPASLAESLPRNLQTLVILPPRPAFGFWDILLDLVHPSTSQCCELRSTDVSKLGDYHGCNHETLESFAATNVEVIFAHGNQCQRETDV